MDKITAQAEWWVQYQPMAGFAYGCRYPSLQVILCGQPLQLDERAAIMERVLEHIPHMAVGSALQDTDTDWPGTVQWLLQLWQTVQSRLGLPVHETGRVWSISHHQAHCCVPTLQSTLHTMAALIAFTLDQHVRDRVRTAELFAHAKATFQALAQQAPRGSNVFLLVKSALNQGIPFRALPGSVYQYGVGCRARWLNSTFTDTTPHISTMLARQKWHASAVLREAGIPVPDHQMVSQAADAVTVARRLGYPVVVKPADTDGGKGVQAGLLNDAEVRQAFAVARQHSTRILLEKHVMGRDYRINVLHGRAVWAIERVPAGVTGDGRHTVAELVQQANADPKRGSRTECVLKPMVLDAEAQRLMAQQNLHDGAVPLVGQFVRLKQAANVSSGGVPVPVFDQMHPDNAQLAVRAAEVLRLDMAGIDLLIPDISVSWHVSGAAICEVNAQPQLGQLTSAHLYGLFLQELLPHRGRIPTVVVFGPLDPQSWVQALVQAWSAQGLCVGTVAQGTVRVGDELLQPSGASAYVGGQMLTLDRRVDAMVLVIEDDHILQTGLPVDRLDVIILADRRIQMSASITEDRRQQRLTACIQLVLPMGDGVVLTTDRFKVSGVDRLTTARVQECRGSIQQVTQEAVRYTAHLLP